MVSVSQLSWPSRNRWRAASYRVLAMGGLQFFRWRRTPARRGDDLDALVGLDDQARHLPRLVLQADLGITHLDRLPRFQVGVKSLARHADVLLRTSLSMWCRLLQPYRP